jgi:hypothetical protein
MMIRSPDHHHAGRLRDRVQAAAFAYESGLVTPGR